MKQMLTDEEQDRYRKAAARLSGGHVNPHAQVQQPADGGGVFVEVTMWVPEAEALLPRLTACIACGASPDEPCDGRVHVKLEAARERETTRG
jgi:hypothetical protein